MNRNLLALASLGTLAAASGPSMAIVSFVGGTYTINHDPGFGAPVTIMGALPTFDGSFQYDATLTDMNMVSSTGRAGVGGIVAPDQSFFGVAFPWRTGISQSDPNNMSDRAATIEVLFTADFTVTGQWPVPSEGYFAGAFFPLGGNVGQGGRVAFEADATFTILPMFLDVSFPPGAIAYQNNQAGPFQQLISEVRTPANTPQRLEDGEMYRIAGRIMFTAENTGGPSGIMFTQVGGAVPAPGVAALLGVAGVVACRRRRS